MKDKLVTLAGALLLLAVLGHFYAKPLFAQVRAALVQNVDEPGRNPLNMKFSPGNTAALVTVPAGKRWVIEAFAANCVLSAGGTLNSVSISTNSAAGAEAFAPAFFLLSGVFPEWVGGGATRLYADPGSVIILAANSPPSGTQCTFSLSGYAINLP
jgi:hypothetical protein